jgi:hypothetical protein
MSKRRTKLVVIGKWPLRLGSFELSRRQTLVYGTPWKTTFPRKSKPRRPGRPAAWRNPRTVRKTESPEKMTVLQGMLIPRAKVPVAITTRR